MKAVFVAAVLLAGCSGAPSTPDAMSDPPPNEPAKLAPAGPDVVDDSINPRAERPVEGEEPTAGAAEVTRADVQSFMRRGPSYILTQVVVDPVHGGSGFEGYKLTSATDVVSAFVAPQLQMGDVITHLNGIRIERPDDYLQAWNRLKDASVLSVDFTREGQKKQATWNVK